MRLTVTDFQSLGHVDLDVAGLTVLVGSSNRGKSALIRALEAVLFNKPGDEFVRVGKKKALVEITNAPTADGKALLDVKWTKGGGKTVYDLSGDLYTKVGQGTPPAITEAGYRDVWIGDKDRKKGEWLRPQVSEQGPGTYFLLDRPGSFVSDVLGAISRHAVLLTAQGRAAGDHRGAKQQLGYKQTELGKAHEQLAALDDVPALVARVEALVARQATLDAQRAKVARLKTLLQWRRVYDMVGALALPAVTPVPADLGETARRLAEVLVSRQRVAALAGMQVRYDAPDVAAVERCVGHAAKVRGLSGHRPRLAALVARELPGSLSVHLPRVDQWAAGAAALGAVVQRRTQALDMVFRCETAVRSSKQEAEEAQAALTALFAGLKVCPTCERPM